jgi:hypothetical protein
MFRYGRSPLDVFFGGGLLSFLPIVLIAVVLLILLAASKGRKGSPHLILEEFSLNENEDAFLTIKGRAAGFWSWILSLFNKASTTSFVCNKQALKYVSSNIKYNIPLVDITCVSSGMLKASVLILIIGIVFCIGIVTIPIGIIILIVYSLNKKTIHFGIYTGENRPMVTITMKRGIIGSIDITKFESAVNALNKAVLNTK